MASPRSHVIGFSLKEWFSSYVNRLARREGRAGLCLLNVNSFYGERWCTPAGGGDWSDPRQDPHWNVEGVAGRTPASAPYLHVGCGIINPSQVFINHCVISPQTWWKWDITKKAESDLEALQLSSSRGNYVSSAVSCPQEFHNYRCAKTNMAVNCTAFSWTAEMCTNVSKSASSILPTY